MEFKGTKGKWFLKGNEIHCDDLLVAYATNSFFRDATNEVEAKNNAKLIAAAPELLKALNDSIDYLEDTLDEYGSDSFEKRKYLNVAKELIKKATE